MKKIFFIFLAVLFISPPLFAESKTHWGKGLLIGAAAGGVAGGLIVQGTKCAGAEPNEDKCGMAKLVVGPTVGLLLGGLLGAIIGNAIPKKPKVAVSPNIFTDNNGSMSGAGLGIQGNF